MQALGLVLSVVFTTSSTNAGLVEFMFPWCLDVAGQGHDRWKNVMESEQ